ncbi:hypothetical protein GS444_15775 [Rhodococcus hoagii]|nr:hypothetical protein [Prescottella equi]
MNLAIESSGTPTDELFNNLSNILSTVAWAGMALGFLIMVVSAGRLAFAYDSYARSSALRGIIGESEPSSGSASPHYSARPDPPPTLPPSQNQNRPRLRSRIRSRPRPRNRPRLTSATPPPRPVSTSIP